MKNNLTNNNTKLLKQIQAELEKIQLSKSVKSTSKAKVQPVTETHRSSVAHDIKNSYIQNLHMKSSMFMLWVVSTVLSYAHKIPYIKGLITALSVMYGRTTIWKILVKVRKVFIIFNAAIGVFMVYKTVGFGYENVLAGFAGMGHSYLEIFTNFTKRLFHWFVELFDHKIIPNIPGDNTSGVSKSLWSNGQIPKEAFNPQYPSSGYLEDSLRRSYNSLLNIQVEPAYTPWYKDYSTWFWIIGGVCVVYLGYKFIIDPLFIHEMGRDVTGVDPRFGNNPQPTAGPSTQPDIALNDNRTGSVVRNHLESIWNKSTKVYDGIRYGINPFN